MPLEIWFFDLGNPTVVKQVVVANDANVGQVREAIWASQKEEMESMGVKEVRDLCFARIRSDKGIDRQCQLAQADIPLQYLSVKEAVRPLMTCTQPATQFVLFIPRLFPRHPDRRIRGLPTPKPIDAGRVDKSKKVYKPTTQLKVIYEELPDFMNSFTWCYHPALASFKHKAANYSTWEFSDISYDAEMCQQLSELRAWTRDTSRAQHPTLLRLLGQLLGLHLQAEGTGDATARVPLATGSSAVVVCVQARLKGKAHRPPSLASLFLDESLAEVSGMSSCPCILINIHRGRIRFFISVRLEDLVIQPVTGWLDLSPVTYGRLCLLFAAARETVEALRIHYLALQPTQGLGRLPQPQCLTDVPSQSLSFLDRLHDSHRDELTPGKPMFSAKLGELNVIVKFTERYNGDAHRLLAEEGYAPALYHVSHLEGGGFMVVMGVAQGVNGCACADGLFLPDASAYHDLRAAVGLLHANGIVHGDIRLSNIMVEAGNDGRWHAQLVDFDWAGRHCEDRYPVQIDECYNWGPGVKGGAVMMKKHDIYRLEMVRRPEERRITSGS